MPKRLYVKGLANIAAYVLLALTALIAIAIGAIKIEKPELMRRIGLFKY